MKRLIGILLGVVLVAVGTAVLVAYVQSARDDAVAEQRLVEVYVVNAVVPRSTTVSELGDRVGLVEVPARLVAADAVTDLTTLDPGFVTAVDLLPGDQLLASRFTDPRLVSRVQVPEGLQEVTISLDAARAIGGSIVIGDTVGVYASFETPAEAPPGDGSTPDTGAPDDPAPVAPANCTSSTLCITDVILDRVLVTGVQFGSNDIATVEGNIDAEEDTVAGAPNSQVLVTLAVSSTDAARVVFAAEFGTVWLTRQNATTVVGDGQTITQDAILGGGA